MDKFLSALAADSSIYAPVLLAGRGRFSDTPLVRYGRVSRAKDICWIHKSYLSPKELLFPPRETLFYFTPGRMEEAPLGDDKRRTVLFLRACDINGIHRLDRIFLENGGIEDSYYRRRREKLVFFLIECSESFENCFCVSMGANMTDDFAAAFRFEEERILAKCASYEYDPLFAKFADSAKYEPNFVEENAVKVRLPEIKEMPLELYSHKIWDEYNTRCIACGRCNTSCVTCSCFSISDIFYDENKNCGERRRVWDGCHLDGFTDMAGGHRFREKNGQRMRFKAFHKVYDFKKRFGENMCVGCGRCDDVCPEYISFSNCINKLAREIRGDSGKNT